MLQNSPEKKALLHIYGVRLIYIIVSVCMSGLIMLLTLYVFLKIRKAKSKELTVEKLKKKGNLG